MNIFLIIVCLISLLIGNAKSEFEECRSKFVKRHYEDKIYPEGYVCAMCDLNADPSCKKGASSKVLLWETDIFEIGFTKIYLERPTEIVIKIDFNKDYYIEINVISDKEKGTAKIILNECSHTEKRCSENRQFTHRDLLTYSHSTFVAIGFRKDKKMNFVARSEGEKYANDLFGKDNVYEFKMPGFYFNTDETMKITVSSKFDKYYDYDGFIMILPTSVGGFIFNAYGYFITVKSSYFCVIELNPNENEGLPYIIKEYYNNSENWRAPPVKWTKYRTVPYFDEKGMKVTSQEDMKVKKEKNPYFDEKTMIRKRCQYLEKPNIDTEPAFTETTTTEFTSTEEETTETTTTATTTLTEDEGTETTKPDDLKKKSISTPMPPPPKIKDQFEGPLYEGEIRINQTVLIPRLDPSEKFLDLYDLFERAGNGSFDPKYFNNVGKGGDDLKNVILRNGTPVDLSGYKFKDPNGKKKKKKKGTSDTKKQTKQIGGPGGAGDASRGQKEVKNISPKYIIILIWMICQGRD